MVEAPSLQGKPGRSLSEFLTEEVLPHLTAEDVFTHEAHRWQKSPGKWRGGCPWHESKSGTSFYVETDSLMWRCAGCQVGGGPIQYLWKLSGGSGISPRGTDFVEVVQRLAKLAGVPFPEREWTEEERERARKRDARRAILETVTLHCQQMLWSSSGEAARQYLHERGFEDDHIRHLRLGYYESASVIQQALTCAGHDRQLLQEVGILCRRFEGYITFPWADESGRPLTIYGTWHTRTPPAGRPKKLALRNPADATHNSWESTKRSPLYFDRARKAGHKDLVLVEGVTDAALAQMCGDARVIACVAAELSRLQVQTLAKHKVQSVTICLDPDSAGDAGILSCIKSLATVSITAYVAEKLPAGLDPDEFIQAHGIKAWQEHLARAIHAYRYQARLILQEHRAGNAWNDSSRDAVIADAVAFAVCLPADRDDELARHFWPEILDATGGNVTALQARVQQSRSRDNTRAQQGHGSAERNGTAQANPEQWEQPIPLTTELTAEAFPLDVLPGRLAEFAEKAAAALVCPIDYVTVPLLTIAGAAVGASRALEIKAGWRERPCLYAAVIGPPGSAKTPALRLVATPVYAEQARRMAFYRRQKIAHEESEAESPKPKLSTIYVSDITTECLAGVLRDNPRGVALIRDELTAWVCGMDQYRARGRGSDRQFFLAAWAGEPVSVFRKNQDDGPVFVPHPFIAVCGGLPPDCLPSLRGERAIADGFLDRILFAYPEPCPIVGENWTCVSDETAGVWNDTLCFLWALQPELDDDGGVRPHFVRLDASGRQAWERFTNALAQEINCPDLPDFLGGPWAKMRGYCARLALIVHYLRLANKEVDHEDVDGPSLDAAAHLVRYFQSQARKVYAALGADPEIKDANRILQWIVREQRRQFKRWEVHKDVRSQEQFQRIEDLDRPLDRLVKHCYLRVQPTPARMGPGRPADPVYEVTPFLSHSSKSGKSGKYPPEPPES